MRTTTLHVWKRGSPAIRMPWLRREGNVGSTASLAEIIEWDIENWAVALRFWTDHTAKSLAHSCVLDIGSRGGGLSLWMALQGATVVCSDLDGPTEAAVRKHRAYGVSHLITYESIDATSVPYRERFDVVCFKSVLGAVGRDGHKERQARAIREIHKALKRDGELFFAENLVASPVHRLLRRQFVAWGDSWRYVSIEEMLDFLAPFPDVDYRVVGFLGAFGRTERQRAILGRVDRMVMNAIAPKSWRYIIVGVAKKGPAGGDQSLR